MRSLSVMIKPASSMCNMDCGYCFYHDLAGQRRTPNYGVMALDTVRAVVKRVFGDVTGQVHFTFQGGEPLLAGKEFFREFERAVEEFAPKNVKIGRSVQTNGTLLDGEWADFFKRHGYLAGISLDGPAEIHNAQRPMAGGKGSFSKVMSEIKLLEKRGVEFNILCVVSPDAARRGAAVYSFLRKQGFKYIQFIPQISREGAPELTEKAYGNFLKTVFDLYFAEKARGADVHVGWFEDIAAIISGRMPAGCGMTGVCAPQIVVEADGGAYPCDFYVRDEYLLGNLAEEGPERLLSSDAAGNFIRASMEMPDDCRACDFGRICRNGCRRYRAGHLSAPGKNRLCGAYREFFEHAGQRLMLLARII